MKKDQDKHSDHRQVLLEWETPEFVRTPRGLLWYMVAGLLMGVLVLYASLSGNWTMAVVLILMAGLFIFTDKQEPRQVRVVITDMGIQYRARFYPFHHINAFWVVYHPPYVRALYLRIASGRRSFRLMRIELDGQKPQLIRKLLIQEIPEVEGAHEPIADVLNRILRLQ